MRIFKLGDFVKITGEAVKNYHKEKFKITRISSCGCERTCEYYKKQCPGYINGDCCGYNKFEMGLIGIPNKNSKIIVSI